MQTQFDCLVVGAGIVGLATGLRLQLDGLRVGVIDRNEPASGCSAGNAGYLSLGNCFPLATPGIVRDLPRMLLGRHGPLVIRPGYLPRLVPWGLKLIGASSPARFDAATQALLRLTAGSIDAYERLLDAAEARDLIRKRGGLHVYHSSEALLLRQSRKSLFEAHGIRMLALDAGEVHEMEPALGGKLAGGVFFPGSAQCVNPQRLGLRLAEQIAQRRGEVIRALATSLAPTQKGWAVHTSSQTLHAKRVVVSAGRWSDELLEPLGFSVPLEAERGYHLMLPQKDVGLSRPVVIAERHFVMTPMEHGLRLAGTVEFAHRDAPMNPRRADMLFEQASMLLPALRDAGATRWMGSRPSLPDSLPAIGQSAKHPGLFYSFGHQHCGLTLAAISADLVAGLIAGRQSQLDLTPYSLERFAPHRH